MIIMAIVPPNATSTAKLCSSKRARRVRVVVRDEQTTQRAGKGAYLHAKAKRWIVMLVHHDRQGDDARLQDVHQTERDPLALAVDRLVAAALLSITATQQQHNVR